jgi:hypothetical protein
MPQPDKHRRLEIVRRRQQVAELYVQGWSQMAIAEHLGISQATVCDDLKRIRNDWRQSAVRDFDQARDKELAKLDRIEREAWAAWERSQKPAQSAVIQGEGAQQPTRKTLKNQNGDPRFLELAMKCIAARRAILGLDAPQRLEHTGAEGKAIAITIESPDERAARIEAALLEEARRRGLVIELGDGPVRDGAGGGAGDTDAADGRPVGLPPPSVN